MNKSFLELSDDMYFMCLLMEDDGWSLDDFKEILERYEEMEMYEECDGILNYIKNRERLDSIKRIIIRRRDDPNSKEGGILSKTYE